MAYTLGIDVGGTKTLAGVIDAHSGRVLGTGKKRSRAEHGPEDLIQRLHEAVDEALQSSKVKLDRIDQVGMGVAGQLDRERGVVLHAPNLANMTNVPLARIVAKRLGKPVRLLNDVEAAAAGEAAFGAGANEPDFVVIFVGTGIGGAIYRDGRPHAGATSTAGEIGHTVVDLHGRLCGCGGLGHLEAYASRTAIVRTILNGLHAGRDSVLAQHAADTSPDAPGGSGIRSRAIADALAAHDHLTRECLEVAADYLAAGLVSVINFYNPPLIILGGGLIEAVDEFFQWVAERGQQAALSVPRRSVRIVKAGLGDNAGIVGAAVLAATALAGK